MPISATGSSGPHGAEAGFTLLEILVALVIVGILAGAVVVTLPDEGLAGQRRAVEQLAAQAAWAGLQARGSGRDHAWGIDAGQGKVWQALPGAEGSGVGGWLPVGGTSQPPPSLPQDLSVQALEVEGMAMPVSGWVVFSAQPTLFVLHLRGAGRQWLLEGGVSGLVSVREMP